MSNFMKIHPVRATLFHIDRLTKTDGQTGRQADIQTLRSF